MNLSVWPPFLIFIFGRLREYLKVRLWTRANLANETQLHSCACLQWWGEIYLNSELSPYVKAFNFIFCIQGHSMDHSLTFLLVCKIMYFNFCYYPNLSSLAFKGSVDKQSRVTISRNFCYYHFLFSAKKLQCIWIFFCVCTVHTGYKSGNMLWTLPDWGYSFHLIWRVVYLIQKALCH